jgi:hypothetical protein
LKETWEADERQALLEAEKASVAVETPEFAATDVQKAAKRICKYAEKRHRRIFRCRFFMDFYKSEKLE